MARNDQVRMPSGQGGLTRYFEESTSKISFSPAAIIVMAVVIMVVVIALHYFGSALL
ncbi:preprotein translocase subunit Sec61beta [archaeon]|jgi:preprotein translocase subunit Sec61beta|nr:preprotein translocase subunit Sec61beta [archaeon]MBT3451115.1 preprotein translocase subunit Sec61beta [archaeon]MBT6868641.1 preprotein translocase subunit Sec61beta [archaeon]MBT7193392.1 preprotein translocase subunit Sec61beta [archaeon]MBT7381438.1 preprotein translocase subunit Sec61beta [archaeon]